MATDHIGARGPRPTTLGFAWCGAVLFAIALAYFLYSYLIRFGNSHDSPTGGSAAIVGNVLLFTAFALHHSILARPPVKMRVRALVTPSLERSTYTWVASILFMTVCAFWQSVPGELYRLTGSAAVAAYGVQLLGLVLTARSSAKLDVLDLAGIRQVLAARRGGATANVRLETAGLYGFVRHPVYFAWVLFVFGAPHMTMTRLVFAVVSTAYLVLAIPFEERSLVDTFGAEYRAYQKRVRWKMVPGVY